MLSRLTKLSFFSSQLLNLPSTLILKQHCKQDKPKQTNLQKITFLPVPALEPNFFCELLIVRGLSVCCLAAAVPHLGDFRSNLSGACPSISLSTLSITVQHCQGNRERRVANSQSLALEQTIITQPLPQTTRHREGLEHDWRPPTTDYKHIWLLSSSQSHT